MSVRCSFQPTELTYSQLSNGGPKWWDTPHQEIMALTWAAAQWKQQRCEQMQKHGGTVMAPEKEKQKKTCGIVFFRFSLFFSLCLSLLKQMVRRIQSWIRCAHRTGTIYSSNSFLFSTVLQRSLFQKCSTLRNKTLLNGIAHKPNSAWHSCFF